MSAEELRRLLALAAKAYGGVEYESYDGWVHTGSHGEKYRGKRWEPEDDDGDSRRLEVALGLSIEHYALGVSVDTVFHVIDEVREDFSNESERATATRLAVLRAAASIGEAMP